jgi:hypothetical protein
MGSQSVAHSISSDDITGCGLQSPSQVNRMDNADCGGPAHGLGVQSMPAAGLCWIPNDIAGTGTSSSSPLDHVTLGLVTTRASAVAAMQVASGSARYDRKLAPIAPQQLMQCPGSSSLGYLPRSYPALGTT